MPSRQDNRRSLSASDKLALLRRHPLFGAIAPELLERLSSYATTRAVHRGDSIFAKGDPGNSLYAVCAGTVKISVPSADGKDAVFNLVGEGEIFGEIALLDGQPRTADAVAISHCDLMVIERRDFLTFVRSEPAVASKLIELLCARLRVLSEHFEEVVFLNLSQRLARILLRLSDEAVRDKRVKLKITQLELSQMLGSTRESVNKQLRVWEKADMIALERGGIALLAPAKFAAIASGDPRVS